MLKTIKKTKTTQFSFQKKASAESRIDGLYATTRLYVYVQNHQPTTHMRQIVQSTSHCVHNNVKSFLRGPADSDQILFQLTPLNVLPVFEWGKEP